MDQHELTRKLAEARRKGREDALRPIIEAALQLRRENSTRDFLLEIVKKIRLLDEAS